MMRVTVAHCRALAIVALVLAGLFALSWAEARGSTVQTGTESLELAWTATLLEARGPWYRGQELDEHTAGIPLNGTGPVAITVKHRATGLKDSTHAWSASVTLASIGPGGRPWWRIDEPLVVEGDDATITITLDVPALIARAEALQREAATPGRLDLTLAIEHTGTHTLDGQALATTRVAHARFARVGELATIDLEPQAQGFHAPADATLPWPAAVLGLLAIGLHGGSLTLTRRDPLAGRAAGTRLVEVRALVPDATTPETDLSTLLATARALRSPVQIDRAAGLAYLPGEFPLVASLDRAQRDVDDEQAPVPLPTERRDGS